MGFAVSALLQRLEEGRVSKNGHLDAVLPKTRCERALRDAVDEIAARSERDISFVIRRYVREGVERDRKKAAK